MSKLTKNQSGFSAVETILVLVVVGIIGFTGWFVWHSRQATDKALTANNSSIPSTAKKTTTAPAKKQVVTTLVYTNKSLGFRLAYPKDWKKENNTLYGSTKEDVIFSSPDLKLLKNSDFGGIEQGGNFSLQVEETTASDLEEYAKDGLDGGPYDFIRTKVDGIEAYRGKCGHPVSDGECLLFVRNGRAYTLDYRHAKSETMTNAKYRDEFNQFVNSFKFD